MEDTLESHDLFGDAVYDFETLRDADDDRLIRLVASYRREDLDPTDMGSISAEGLAVLLLRRRGYSVSGDGADFSVSTPSGETLTMSDV